MGMKEQILKLRTEGLSYRQIQRKLGCSRGTISYHIGDGQKAKTKSRSAILNPLVKRIDAFKRGLCGKIVEFSTRKSEDESRFGYKDVLAKFGQDPICYLTGRKIDLKDCSSYELDHIVPASAGGSIGINNLGLTCRDANRSKADLAVEQFLTLCKEVLEHNGYTVMKFAG